MKAKSMKVADDVVVVVEDENKTVKAMIGKEVERLFTTYRSALQWLEKEAVNGNNIMERD